MFGLVWTQSDIAELSAGGMQEEGELASPAPDSLVRYPLSLLVRPELFKVLTGIEDEGDKPPVEATSGMMYLPKGTLSLANLSKEEFLARVGAAPATGPARSLDDRFGSSPRGNTPAPASFRNIPKGHRR